MHDLVVFGIRVEWNDTVKEVSGIPYEKEQSQKEMA